ncbi:hypothetical protein [Tropicimonas isoalkanivorans]|uniref:PH domain-containing protein n=1 Tax=Tropicimonas isoalkanivorans TaxID=441112 RepID=A0A1I1N5Q0_9RHOB|nr:hypothetical protein [Tropicimonas isoalkanivorans]SFC93001.1 hypothetical protein SAMN04488094_111150 [Tropicimonas isoalkanivorans]
MDERDGSAETVLASWPADRGAYIRGYVRLAVIGSVVSAAVLLALGNDDPWVGPVGVVLALAVRGFYLASEELSVRWDLTGSRLVSSFGKSIPLRDIARVRRLGTAVQVVTRGGDKHLMKHLAQPEVARDRIARAAGVEDT